MLLGWRRAQIPAPARNATPATEPRLFVYSQGPHYGDGLRILTSGACDLVFMEMLCIVWDEIIILRV
jgi:hypothetical protein